MSSYEELNHIAESFGSPFYLFDRSTFMQNFDDLSRAFTRQYEKLIIGYSYKTNYIPHLCQIIRDRGGYAEVVSRMEYELALKIGQDPAKIIFNGPVKTAEDIEMALNHESMLNLDSEYEIDHVIRFARQYPHRRINVGLRINIGLSDHLGVSHVQNRLKVGRFGFSPEPAHLKKVIAALSQSDNIKITGLHGHSSTTDRSLWCYEMITRTLCEIAENYLPDSVVYINVGGGMFGFIPPEMRWMEVPSFDEYAIAICQVLNQNNWVRQKIPTLVIEPGIALVANTLSFVTRIIGTKMIQDQLFVTVDGSAYNTKPTFHKINQPFNVIKKTPASPSVTFHVVGSTCMEKDYLLTEVAATLPEIGDFIKINNVGAYTVVLTPPFINVAPAIVTLQGQEYVPIRDRQSFSNLWQPYQF